MLLVKVKKKKENDTFGLLNKLHSSQFETSYLVMYTLLFRIQYSFTLSIV